MLTELYIEALLVDEDLADMVCKLWNTRVITDEVAAMVWCILASTSKSPDITHSGRI